MVEGNQGAHHGTRVVRRPPGDAGSQEILESRPTPQAEHAPAGGDHGTYHGAGFSGKRLGGPGPHVSRRAQESTPEAPNLREADTAEKASASTPATPPIMHGKWKYVSGIPGWRAWPLGMELRCNFVLSQTSLTITQRGAVVSIPLAAIEEAAFGSTFLIRYAGPDGGSHTAQFEFPYIWDMTRTGNLLLAQLNQLGVNGGRTDAGVHEAETYAEGQVSASQAAPPEMHCLSCNSQAQWLPNGQLWCPACQTALEIEDRTKQAGVAAGGVILGIALLLFALGAFDPILAQYFGFSLHDCMGYYNFAGQLVGVECYGPLGWSTGVTQP